MKLRRIALWTAGGMVAVLAGLYAIGTTVAPAPSSAPPSVTVAATMAASTEPAPTQAAAPATTQPAVQQPAVQQPAAAPTTAPAITFTQQIATDVGSYANLITSAEETEPGRIEVGTSIVDPRGADGSAPARQALGICQRIRNAHPDAQRITIYEQDGTTFVLYGHPMYGNTCTEV